MSRKNHFCPECGTPGAGHFCGQCGGALDSASRHAPGRPAGGNDVAWWVAGAAMVGLILVLFWNVAGRSAAASASIPAPAPAPSLAQLTPRQTADQLFNRVMTASDNGDAATAAQFLPTALTAYESARPLDMDGRFHVALLYGTAGDHEASLASALEILETEPGHILGLVAAAKASLALGRTAEAAAYYQAILDHHDAEIARPLPEYQMHARYFGVAREEARAFLAGG